MILGVSDMGSGLVGHRGNSAPLSRVGERGAKPKAAPPG